MSDPGMEGGFSGFDQPGARDPYSGSADTTGRYLVLFQEDAVEAGVSALQDAAGLRVASARDFNLQALGGPAGEMDDTDLVVLEELGVGVMSAPPDQLRRASIAADGAGAILAVEPERVVYALTEAGLIQTPAFFPEPSPDGGAAPPPVLAPAPGAGAALSIDYLRGYKAAIDNLLGALTGAAAPGPETLAPELAPTMDLTQATWGLHATRVVNSRFSGKGIAVAVLDTGMDLTHPDFADRVMESQSFVPGQAVQDGNGHGTHCIGTACGPQRPSRLPRYGIANNAQIHAGKVLSNQGSGADGGILAGINWALASGCRIVSMSLGARVFPGQTFSTVYEQVARRALARGTLIIAAAGNDSSRPARSEPVSHPANCPSILAVGAVDINLRIAGFSNAGLSPGGGEVNIAGPGVTVHSSWPAPLQYRAISGTSMATPHVAGIAALWAEATGQNGLGLAIQLLRASRRLPLPVRDVGWGLVQAP